MLGLAMMTKTFVIVEPYCRSHNDAKSTWLGNNDVTYMRLVAKDEDPREESGVGRE